MSAPVAPNVSGLEVRGTSSNYVRLGWTGNTSQYDVLYRKAVGETDWHVDGGIRDDVYTIIDLEPDSVYLVKVRAQPEQISDANGQAVDLGQPFETPEFRVRTRSLQPAPVRKLAQWPLLGAAAALNLTAEPNAPQIKLWPTQRLAALPADAVYPSINEYKGSFYVVTCHGGGIYLSQVRPDDFALEGAGPVELVAPTKDVPSCQGMPSTAVFRDKLWLMWNRQPTGDSQYGMTDSRQMLLSYDFATGQVGEPIVLDALRPDAGTWQGGLIAWQEQLWLMWMEVWVEDGVRRTRIVVASYLPNTGMGKPVVWEDCPTRYPNAPSLNLFENQILIVYSDSQASEQRAGQEPLWCVRFGGHDFHGLQKLLGLGRNRWGRGVQVGDSFYLVCGSNAEWLLHGGRYYDLTLIRIGPKGRMVEAVGYVDDQKHNAFPDLVARGNTVYVLYSKYDHEDTDPSYPAKCLGTYWGKIDTP